MLSKTDILNQISFNTSTGICSLTKSVKVNDNERKQLCDAADSM